MRDATGESTLDAKEAFERAAAERGVVIKGYILRRQRPLRGTHV